MELSNAVLKNTANISHLYDTIQEIVIHKSASTIIPALCLTFSRTRIFTPTIRANLHRHEPCLHTLWYLLFSLPPNLFHHSWSLRQGYRQSYRHLLSVTNSKQKDNILVFNTFPYRHITDMSPTFTSALPPLLPPHYRQKEIYTDIYTDKTASTFSVHRPAANLITFAKLSQKGKN